MQGLLNFILMARPARILYSPPLIKFFFFLLPAVGVQFSVVDFIHYRGVLILCSIVGPLVCIVS